MFGLWQNQNKYKKATNYLAGDLMKTIDRLTRWFAKNLGVDTIRKERVYLDLAQSATLADANYWIQVLFAAGIATLGLVLNSPAVIIGAMLISPLIGSIDDRVFSP